MVGPWGKGLFIKSATGGVYLNHGQRAMSFARFERRLSPTSSLTNLAALAIARAISRLWGCSFSWRDCRLPASGRSGDEAGNGANHSRGEWLAVREMVGNAEGP